MIFDRVVCPSREEFGDHCPFVSKPELFNSILLVGINDDLILLLVPFVLANVGI